MTTGPARPFDGSEYRRSVLVALRERNPAEVDDVFWLAHVPRDAADDAEITARLREARGFLNKERTRARQAAVATAVLKEWPRVEATLLDRATRDALRARLEAAGAAAPGPAPGARPAPARAAGPLTAEERRLRQVAKALDELGRLRSEPEIGEDLFAFLGLPVTAPSPMVRERTELVAEVNRRRRPDRERSLIDDLLVHSRRLLVEGDPARYRATFGQADKARAVELLLTGDLDAARGAVDAARAMGVSDGDLQVAVAPRAKANEATVPLSPLGLGVWCPSCGTISPMGSATCHNCRAGLQVRCASCRGLAAADCPRCPSCNALLDEQRAPLLARRAGLLEEAAALAEVDGAPAAEHEARLRALVRAHPEWQAVAARLATLPPPPPRDLALEITGQDVALRWAPPAGTAVDAYLVERHGPQGSRVLGRTGLLEWDDRRPGPEDSWTVRCVRGAATSAPATVAARPVQEAPPPAEPPVEDPPPAEPPVEDPPPAEPPLPPPTPLRPRPAPGPGPDGPPDIPPAAATPGLLPDLRADRAPDGTLHLTWGWPEGVTEAYVVTGAAPPPDSPGPDTNGRKVTNMRYELDHGVHLDGVAAGTHLAVYAGRRDGAGRLTWLPAPARAVAA